VGLRVSQLAITRAGKGQTVIEPTLDMWTREKRLNNMVVNDPKGELLVKNYVRATVRGMQVVQFNLINAMKTDIYNRAPRFIVKSYNHI
jgi:type IV secretory pathway TraG/TraD family ATPase VirD4